MKYALNTNKDLLTDLRKWKRNPTVEEWYAVPSESREELAHIVYEVRCLDKHKDKADAVVDERTIYLCSCENFKFDQWPSEPPETLDVVGSCKHVRAEFKAVAAQNDDDQSTLGGSNPVGK